jgi:hypothetical protein
MSARRLRGLNVGRMGHYVSPRDTTSADTRAWSRSLVTRAHHLTSTSVITRGRGMFHSSLRTRIRILRAGRFSPGDGSAEPRNWPSCRSLRAAHGTRSDASGPVNAASSHRPTRWPRAGGARSALCARATSTRTPRGSSRWSSRPNRARTHRTLAQKWHTPNSSERLTTRYDGPATFTADVRSPSVMFSLSTARARSSRSPARTVTAP